MFRLVFLATAVGLERRPHTMRSIRRNCEISEFGGGGLDQTCGVSPGFHLGLTSQELAETEQATLRRIVEASSQRVDRVRRAQANS